MNKKGLIGSIIIFLVICGFLFLVVNFIIFNMVKEICDESELKPVRYELGGLFGNQKIPIVTTPENADGYEKVCIRTGEPTPFSISENLEYLFNKTSERTANGK